MGAFLNSYLAEASFPTTNLVDLFETATASTVRNSRFSLGAEVSRSRETPLRLGVERNARGLSNFMQFESRQTAGGQCDRQQLGSVQQRSVHITLPRESLQRASWCSTAGSLLTSPVACRTKMILSSPRRSRWDDCSSREKSHYDQKAYWMCRLGYREADVDIINARTSITEITIQLKVHGNERIIR